MKKLLTTHCHLFVCLLLFVIFGLYPKGVSATTSLANQFTVSLWVNPTGSVVSKALAVNDSSIRVFTDASGFANCQIYTASWQTGAVGTVALPLSTWTHVACTYDKATIRLYINGVPSGTPPAQTAAVNDSGNVWKIGQDAGGTYGDLTGTIDDVRFYDYARTAKQVTEDMLGGRSLLTSGGTNVSGTGSMSAPVGYWKFDEGRDNACTGGVNDACNSGSGGSALDGAQSGMSVPATATSGWTNSGKFGKGLLFDGTDDVVDATNIAAMNGATQMTISFWAKATTWTSNKALITKWDFATQGGWAVQTGQPGGCGNSRDVMIFIATALNDSGNTYGCSTDSALTNATWAHIVIAYDGTQSTNATKLRIYINGVQKTLTFGGTIPTSLLSPTATVKIGTWGGTITTRYFAGTMDEVKLYTYPLTSDEVKTDFNRGKTLVLGALGSNTTYQSNGSNQTYCVPGDATSCAAPVAEWNLDEFTGTSAYDTSGNGNTGTLGAGNSAPTWTAGKQGSGLKFDGNNDYVSVNHSSSIQLTTGFSISAWVNPSSLSTSQTVVCKGSTAADPDYLLSLSRGGQANKVSFYNGTAWIDSNASALSSTNTWSYVTVTYNNSSYVLYVNGVNVGSTAGSGSIQTSTNNLQIGMQCNSISNPFSGKMDQVRIFNYARTAAQVAWDYNRGGPVGWWKMDECQGSTASDSSGNANNGTITVGASGTQTAVGDCTTSATTAWNAGATGKFNSSLNFDGTDDYIDVGTSMPMQSVAFWVKPTSTTASMVNISPTAYISASSGTISATGFTSPTYYVNGLATTSPVLTANVWNHIVVTTGTSMQTTALTIAKANGTFTAGQMDDVRVYNYALTSTQIKNIYNGGFSVFYGPNTGSP